MRLLGHILAVCTVACASAVEPVELSVQMSVSRVLGGTPPRSVTTVAGGVDITGYIDVNEPCYDFTASAVRDRDAITVTVSARRRPGFCTQDLARFAYQIAVRSVPAGSYRLTVVHDHVGPPTFRASVFEGVVDVP